MELRFINPCIDGIIGRARLALSDEKDAFESFRRIENEEYLCIVVNGGGMPERSLCRQ